MVTSSGTCKKTSLSNFSRPRKGGIIAIELRDDDKLVGQMEPRFWNSMFNCRGMAITCENTRNT